MWAIFILVDFSPFISYNYNMKTYTLTHENKKIEYTLVRRSIKRVRLKVKRDLSIEVVANKSVPLSFIEDLIRNNINWILAQQEKLSKLPPPANLNYLENEVVYFLGIPYKIKLVTSTKNYIELNDDSICFYLISPYHDQTLFKEKLLDGWYREQGKKIFQTELKKIHPLLRAYNIEYPDVKLRKMKSCWGSCHYTKNFIVLNTNLVKYPIACIDYVILHELVHFIHPNHSKNFYYVLENLMPDWKVSKNQLKNNL